MPSITYVPSRIGEGDFTDWQAPASGATDTGKVWAWNNATGRYEPTALPTVITDHGGLSGLGDDDHTQYPLLTGARAFTGAQTFDDGIICGIIRPASDSTFAVRVRNAAGTTTPLTIDTINGRVGIGSIPTRLLTIYAETSSLCVFSTSSGEQAYFGTGNQTIAGGDADELGFAANKVALCSQSGQRRLSVRSNGVGIGVTEPTALLHLAAGNTTRAQMRFADGVEPTTRNDGDVWRGGNAIHVYFGGVEYTLDMTAA